MKEPKDWTKEDCESLVTSAQQFYKSSVGLLGEVEAKRIFHELTQLIFHA